MQKKILVIFVLVCGIIYSQSINEIKKISTFGDSISKMTNNLIKNDSIAKAKTEIEEDSLKKELLFYKVKEDYFATVVEEQASRFSLIITCILGLFGLISFSIFKLEAARMRKVHKQQIKTINDKLITFEKDQLSTNIKLAQTMGHLNISISIMFNKPGSSFSFLKHRLKGIHYSMKSKSLSEKETNINSIKINFKHINEKLDNLNNDDIEKIKKNIKVLNNIINGFDIEISKNLDLEIAKLKVRLSEV